MSTPNGGPAFPTTVEREEWHEDKYRTVFDREGGMTLRDFFAGQAIAGGLNEFFTGGDTWKDYGDFAQSCYRLADAMLAERSKP